MCQVGVELGIARTSDHRRRFGNPLLNFKQHVVHVLQDDAVEVPTVCCITQAEIGALATVVVCRRCDLSWWSHPTCCQRGVSTMK